jgi:hypothetical protein
MELSNRTPPNAMRARDGSVLRIRRENVLVMLSVITDHYCLGSLDF